MTKHRPLAPQGLDPLDDKVRARLTEIMASAGVPHSRISLEVLYFLPKDFLNAYEQMFTRAIKADGGESRRNESQQQAGDLGKAKGDSRGSRGKRYKRTFVVLDDAALQLKTRMDKRLRMIARDISNGLAGVDEEGGPVRGVCDGCGRFMQMTWLFCPACGAHRSEGD
jgi:hypothetical protein